jgi:hypothetical protein
MKDLRTRFVAIELNDNGTCKKVLSCVNLTESEYQKLLNESLASKQHGLAKAQKQKKDIENICNDIANEYLLLAKSIYDNFVDRGLLEEDEELQKQFYDFIFNGGDFVPTNPDFMKILNKIRGN